ncbi:MAG: TIGR04086 family membrane protein [Lachnospiraceae bacterium]|nr:TIGR04086 family membrane protein [Lachnospiraceae bacterium]
MAATTSWRMIRALIVSFLLTLLMLAGLTFLLYKFRLPESQITVGIYAVYIISCLAGGFLAGKAMKTKRFLWGLMAGILYFLFLFAMSALQDQGILSDLPHILTVLGICAVSGMVGGMAS